MSDAQLVGVEIGLKPQENSRAFSSEAEDKTCPVTQQFHSWDCFQGHPQTCPSMRVHSGFVQNNPQWLSIPSEMNKWQVNFSAKQTKCSIV